MHSDRTVSKKIETDKESTTGSPKPGNRQGDGASVIDEDRTQVNIKGMQRNNGNSSQVEASVLRHKAGLKRETKTKGNQLGIGCRELYRQVYNLETLIEAYRRIKSKPGNMTPGVDKETLDGISMKKLEAISRSLKDQSFQFKPVRRIYIPKANGKMRPLGIPSPMDKVVQEAMRMVLESIYEPTFKDSSHGFRPGRGTHSALKQVST